MLTRYNSYSSIFKLLFLLIMLSNSIIKYVLSSFLVFDVTKSTIEIHFVYCEMCELWKLIYYNNFVYLYCNAIHIIKLLHHKIINNPFQHKANNKNLYMQHGIFNYLIIFAPRRSLINWNILLLLANVLIVFQEEGMKKVQGACTFNYYLW